MTPFMVSLQVHELVVEKLKMEQFRIGLDLVLEHRQEPYMDAALFQQWPTTLLTPFIDGLRTNDEFTAKPAILLSDTSSSGARRGVSPDSERTQYHRNHFPPHTTQIFRAFGLSLFGALQKKTQCELPFGNDKLIVGFIQQVFHSLKQTPGENHVKNALKMLGFECDVAQTPYTPLLREEKLRQNQGFREI
jgi:hypothetical protein